MKLAFAFAVLALSTLAHADDSVQWARTQSGLSDARLVPYACNAENGSSEFKQPSATTKIKCLTSIEGSKEDIALIETTGKQITAAYRITKCNNGVGASDGGQYLHREQECSIQIMDAQTLEASGRASKLSLVTEADPSGENFYLKFKLAGKKVDTAVAPIDELQQDF